MINRFIQYIQYGKHYSSHTVFSYKNDLNQFALFIQNTYNLDIQLAAPEHIRDWIVSLHSVKTRPSSINRKLSTLKSFYRFLEKEEVVDRNPTLGIHFLRKEHALPTFFKEDAMENALELLEAGAEDFSQLRDKIIIQSLYETGMRRGELLLLKDNDFNLHANTVKILGKGGKERIIPIREAFAKDISNYIKQKNTVFGSVPYFIVTNKGEKAYPNLIYNAVRNNMHPISSQQKRSPHVIRHTFASGMPNHGAEINTVKTLLGHASLAATQVYTHTSFEQMKEIYKQSHPRK